MAANGMSTRAIAKAVGGSKSEVNRAAQSSTVPAGTVGDLSDKIVGTDGKARPARKLTPEEREGLAGHIARDGEVRVPVVVTRQFVEDGQVGVVDGINRLTIAAEAGLAPDKVPFDYRRYRDLEHARDDCAGLNDNRRHLTPEQKRRRKERNDMKAREMIANGMSTRAVAEALGVSHTEVQRAASVSGGTHVPPETSPPAVAGTDGKKYPRRKLTPEQRAERDKQIIALRAKGRPA